MKPGDGVSTPDLVEHAVAAEAAGWDGVFVSDSLPTVPRRSWLARTAPILIEKRGDGHAGPDTDAHDGAYLVEHPTDRHPGVEVDGEPPPPDTDGDQ